MLLSPRIQLTTIALALVVMSVCLVWWYASDRDRDAHPRTIWAARDPHGPREVQRPDANTPFSAMMRERWKRFDDMFYQKAAWGAAEQRELLDAMSFEVQRIDFDEDMTQSDLEAINTVRDAIGTFMERYVTQMPIEPETGLALQAQVRALLNHPNRDVRLSALVGVNWMGMHLRDRDVEARIRAMQNDPQPLIAGLARRVIRDMTVPRYVESWNQMYAKHGF